MDFNHEDMKGAKMREIVRGCEIIRQQNMGGGPRCIVRSLETGREVQVFAPMICIGSKSDVRLAHTLDVIQAVEDLGGK